MRDEAGSQWGLCANWTDTSESDLSHRVPTMSSPPQSHHHPRVIPPYFLSARRLSSTVTCLKHSVRCTHYAVTVTLPPLPLRRSAAAQRRQSPASTVEAKYYYRQ